MNNNENAILDGLIKQGFHKKVASFVSDNFCSLAHFNYSNREPMSYCITFRGDLITENDALKIQELKHLLKPNQSLCYEFQKEYGNRFKLQP